MPASGRVFKPNSPLFISVMKKLLSAIAIAALPLSASAQAIVSIPVNQNPVFEVSTNHVEVTVPDSNDDIILGADVVITGGSGSYTYRWTDQRGNDLGTESELHVSEPGLYTLDIADTCDCLQTVTFNVATASLDEIAGSILTISPNPSEGFIRIDGFDPVQITAVNMSGHLAATLTSPDGTHIHEADLSTLPSGIYLLTLTDNARNVIVSRIVIK